MHAHFGRFGCFELKCDTVFMAVVVNWFIESDSSVGYKGWLI